MGISLESIKWAFQISGNGKMAYWHPLTWLSLMLDYQLFGLNAGMLHLSNVFYHLINTILLFFVFRIMTGAVWRSAFIAALFALHPVNVDTVAWIAERKNLLSTTFWLLTTLSYLYYVKQPGIYRYLLVSVVFILGLLAKPMLVTLPFVFLLLDYWPLNRLHSEKPVESNKDKKGPASFSGLLDYERSKRIVLEKIPLIAVSLISIYISSQTLKNIGSSVTLDMVPMALRIENAAVSYVSYLYKLIWPAGLSIYHPFPVAVPLWQASLAFIVLMAVSLAAVYNLKKRPYLFVGWFWFVGTLVPVSGIMQGGLWPSYAERWAYVPYIGLFLIISWCAYEFVSRFRINTYATAAAAAIIMALLLGKTWIQIGNWKDEVILYNHAIAVNPDNPVAHYNLGLTYAFKGMREEAIHHYQEALRITPNNASVYYDMGLIYYDLNNLADAIQCFKKAITIKPDYENPRLTLSEIYFKNGDTDNALEQLTETPRYIPGSLAAHNKMGIILTSVRKTDEALVHFNQVLQMDSKFKNIHNNIGNVYLVKGEFATAIEEFKKEIQAYPNSTDAYINMGISYMNINNANEAINCFKQAAAIDPSSPKIRVLLERALIERNRPASGYDEKGTEALARLQEAVRNDGSNIQALQKIARYYASNKEYGKSLAYLEKIVKINPDNPEGYYNIACIYSLKNDVAQSANWLKKALDHGFKDMNMMRNDEDLQNFRASTYYKDLMK
jgi:protein O-mannosyl-transferase